MKPWLIKNGPSKFDLMASVFDNKIVEFTLSPIDETDVLVASDVLKVRKSRSKEKDAKNFWDIEIIPVGITLSFQDEDCNAFSGFYDSKTRRGNLKETTV